MQIRSRKLGRGIAGALATLVLTAGVAFALETLSVAVPEGDASTVTAVVLVDDGGATVYASRPGGRDVEEVEFRIIFDETAGEVSINGGHGVVYVPGQAYTVIASAYQVDGAWFVDILVRDAEGQTVVLEIGAPMSGAPTVVTATAESIIDLGVE